MEGANLEDTEKDLLAEVEKEIEKLKYYLEESDEIMEERDFIHLILGDSMYSRIRTEKVFKGNPGQPFVEETTFGWVFHGGDEYTSDGVCMYLREVNDYEKLYSLDVVGVKDRGKNGHFDVMRDFKENIARRDDGRKRLQNVERRLSKNENLRDYANIIEEQLWVDIVEEAPERPTGERVFYIPHKPFIRESAVTTKPLLWDIMVRARMSTSLLLGDIEKAFLQIGVEEGDRDAFRFLFNVKGEERHLRFMRVPFGVEASPFVLGATLQNHLQHQGTEFEDTVRALKENTYIDNLMEIAGDQEQLVKFKKESTEILENAPSFQFISGNQMLDLWRARTCRTLVRFWDTNGTRKKTLWSSQQSLSLKINL
ncbi:uncharacterized protein [Montipora foliosa]|uniref:uncharacterized protein n=1 Tax=Montipora foliosa TaxID=591990 RepID=UPI0035F1B8E5